jgi:hypothetical protein
MSGLGRRTRGETVRMVQNQGFERVYMQNAAPASRETVEVRVCGSVVA